MSEGTIPGPLSFRPIFKEKIWGGDTLGTMLGKRIAPGASVGESWELSGFGTDSSRVRGGPYHGAALSELIERFGTALLGPAARDAQFPLLYKFIDAADKLSVQVHPDDQQARTKGWGSFGKTECWYVADARPGAKIIVGFRPGVTGEQVRRAVRARSLDPLLNYIEIQRGDVLFIPAGTVHAILDGTLIYEVQETSDTTLRLYDWGRLDAGGNPRALHVEEALDVMDTTWHEHHKIPPVRLPENFDGQHLFRAACRYFALEEYRFETADDRALPKKQSFQVITLLDGAMEVRTDGGDLRAEKGETVLIPAAGELSVSVEAGTHFLLSSVPDLRHEIVEPLRTAGVEPTRIALLGGNPARNDLASVVEI